MTKKRSLSTVSERDTPVPPNVLHHPSSSRSISVLSSLKNYFRRNLRSSFFILLTIVVAVAASIIGYVVSKTSLFFIRNHGSVPDTTECIFSSLFSFSSPSSSSLLSFPVLSYPSSTIVSRALSPIEEACTLYCEGPLLHAVQMNYIYNDSKTFVDMPCLLDPMTVNLKFKQRFPSYATELPPRDELINFIHEHFLPAGSDLLPWSPTDWVSLPSILSTLQNYTLRQYTYELHFLWLQLGRQLSKDIQYYPQRHSLLYIPYPLIVPGGRFIEPYFWDTYFIILGLLRSNMVRTAEGMVLNLVHLTAQLGFVPNGGRAYYAVPGRSQPPLLSRMIAEVFGATGNVTFLQHCYAALRIEYQYWMQTEGEYGHAVFIKNRSSKSSNNNHTSSSFSKPFLLNRYVTDQHIPRPESYSEDIHTARLAGYQPTDPSAQILFSEIAAAAESGWDFTSRYFADYNDITTCDTSHIIPIDLNTMMYTFEQDLAYFARLLAQTQEQLCSTVNRTTVSGTVISPSPSGTTKSSLSKTIIYCRRHPHRPVCRLPKVPNAVYDLSEQVSRLALDRTKSSSFHDYSIDGTDEGISGNRPDSTSSSSSVSSLQCVPGLQEALWDEAIRYADAAEERAKAIEALMWDESSAQWYDLYIPSALNHTEPVGTPHAKAGRASVYTKNITQQTLEQRYSYRTDLVMDYNVYRSDRITSANYVPLWAGLGNVQTNHTRTRAIVRSLKTSGLIGTAGIFTTLARTVEQWDWPNAWSPIMHMIITGLNATGETSAQDCGERLAKDWLKSGMQGFFNHGYSHEKYDARNYGTAGAGGEYTPQVGFGWTNGVALDLAVRYNFSTLEGEE